MMVDPLVLQLFRNYIPAPASQPKAAASQPTRDCGAEQDEEEEDEEEEGKDEEEEEGGEGGGGRGR